MVGRAKWPASDQGLAVDPVRERSVFSHGVEQSGHAVDRGGLQRFIEREVGEDRRDALGEHRFS